MRVRVLMSRNHPEYRLVLPSDAGMEGVAANLRSVIEQMGEWEERSLDEMDASRPEHRGAMADIAAHGACLWMISMAYAGRVEVEVAPPRQDAT